MQLETERLILRNYKMTDLEDYWEYVQMEDVGPRCGWPAYTDKSKAKERLEVESKKQYQFAIELKSSHKVIGSVELMDTKTERYPNCDIKNSKEIGFLLSKNYWGHGYMPEAVKEVMRFAFDDLGVDKIYISHAERNTNSGRVQEKLGFKIIGRVEEYREWVDGQMTDSIIRCMTKEEWERN